MTVAFSVCSADTVLYQFDLVFFRSDSSQRSFLPQHSGCRCDVTVLAKWAMMAALHTGMSVQGLLELPVCCINL